jgi:hypothetical protein
MSEDIDVLLAERAIQRVLTTCSRGVDRFDFESVRNCYWPDGTDDHGSFVGGVDEFIAFVEVSLDRSEGGFAEGYVRGLCSPDDIVYRILDGSRG